MSKKHFLNKKLFCVAILLALLQLVLVINAHNTLDEEALELCRSNDSEECWLNALPEILSRNGKALNVTLYSGKTVTFTDTYETCSDPCGPLYEVANFIPEFGYLLLEVVNEYHKTVSLVSLITGEEVTSLNHKEAASPDYRYYFWLHSEAEGGVRFCGRTQGITIHRLNAKHVNAAGTEVFEILDTSSGKSKNAIVTWANPTEVVIREYESDDSNCAGSVISLMSLTLMRDKEGDYWKLSEPW